LRVLIDTTYARRAPLSGTGVYIDRLCEELRLRNDVEAIPVWNRDRRPPAGGGLGSMRNLASDARWMSVGLPALAASTGAELIHHPLPAYAVRCRVPQVITVVDLVFERLPECFDRRYRTYAHLAHRAAARRAAKVIAISQTTAEDVRSLWGVRPERIAVAPLGPGQELAVLPRAEPPRHFLYLGDDEPRKNLATLLAAYARYRDSAGEPLELVLAGSAGASGLGVRMEHRPSADRVAELLAQAAALIHPSLYEGFGLTALEAMRAGTPVLAARSPGLIEVCATAAAYAEPFDVDGFAAQMQTIASEPSFRDTLRERGYAHAREFSWPRCAQAHAGAYSLALGG